MSASKNTDFEAFLIQELANAEQMHQNIVSDLGPIGILIDEKVASGIAATIRKIATAYGLDVNSALNQIPPDRQEGEQE